MRKGTTSRKMQFFVIFQAVTISRPQEPQASHLVCRQFGSSTSQIVRHKIAIFECNRRARSPRPHRMWAGLAICSECSMMMEEYSCQV